MLNFFKFLGTGSKMTGSNKEMPVIIIIIIIYIYIAHSIEVAQSDNLTFILLLQLPVCIGLMMEIFYIVLVNCSNMTCLYV